MTDERTLSWKITSIRLSHDKKKDKKIFSLYEEDGARRSKANAKDGLSSSLTTALLA